MIKDLNNLEKDNTLNSYVQKPNLYDRVTKALDDSAHLNYKVHPYLGNYEVANIREAIMDFVCEDTEMKAMLIKELSDFENKILENYENKKRELARKQLYCESQIRVIEGRKFKMVFDKLSQIKWPYDEKTRECDKQILVLQAQAKNYQRKLEILSTSKPVADEKDLLKFKLNSKAKLQAYNKLQNDLVAFVTEEDSIIKKPVNASQSRVIQRAFKVA